MSTYSTLQAHRSMVFDDLRNTGYAEAIKNAVDKESVVLDLGAGLGLHGFIAAHAGARKVYLAEPSPVLEMARQLVKESGLSEQIECIAGKIEEIKLPEKVDVIISVFTGNFLLTEDLLPSLFFARDKYLAPGGKLIPDRAVMDVVPVCAADYYAKHVDCWKGDAQGVNLSPMREYAANSLIYDRAGQRKAEHLSEPAELMEMNFYTATEASCKNQITVKANRDGLCHGWLGWFRTRLGDTWLSTSPQAKQTHWSQVFLPLSKPIAVTKGDIISFALDRPEHGEWTWRTGHNGKKQRQSTFFSQPLTPAIMQRKSDAHQPRISERGQAMMDVLSRFNGNETTADIIEHIRASYKTIFPNKNLAEKFVKDLVEMNHSNG